MARFGMESDDSRSVVDRHVVQTGVAELIADPDVEGAWLLRLNGVAQSHVDLNDPQMIAFEYMTRIVEILDCLAPVGAIEALHLGGGAMTLPRCLAVMRPGSLQRVVELDGDLLRLVLHRMPLDAESLIETEIADAAVALAQAPDDSYDVIVADVFQGGKVPDEVRTAEFAQAAARVLRPEGCYVANLMDSPPLALTRAQARLLRSAFGEVALLADASVLRGRREGNLLLIGAREGTDWSRLVRRVAADPFSARLEYGERLERFLSRSA